LHDRSADFVRYDAPWSVTEQNLYQLNYPPQAARKPIDCHSRWTRSIRL